MSTFQPLDTKKEDFRKYLEGTGLIDALTKVFVGLYEEPVKPSDPFQYVRQQLGGTGEADTEALKTENDELRKKLVELQERVDELTAEPK